MAYNEELARQRRLDHYRNHLERQVASQHRYFVLLLALSNIIIVAVQNSGLMPAGHARGATFLAVGSLIHQAVGMLVGSLSHRRELGDLNFAEKQGTWPEGRDQRMYYAGKTCQVLNIVSLALATLAAFLIIRH